MKQSFLSDFIDRQNKLTNKEHSELMFILVDDILGIEGAPESRAVQSAYNEYKLSRPSYSQKYIKEIHIFKLFLITRHTIYAGLIKKGKKINRREFLILCNISWERISDQELNDLFTEISKQTSESKNLVYDTLILKIYNELRNYGIEI